MLASFIFCIDGFINLSIKAGQKTRIFTYHGHSGHMSAAKRGRPHGVPVVFVGIKNPLKSLF